METDCESIRSGAAETWQVPAAATTKPWTAEDDESLNAAFLVAEAVACGVVVCAAYPAKAERQQAQPSATSRTETEKAGPTQSHVMIHTLSRCQVRRTGASDVHRRPPARQGRLDMHHGRGLISGRTPTSTSEPAHAALCVAQVLSTPSDRAALRTELLQGIDLARVLHGHRPGYVDLAVAPEPPDLE